MLNDWSANLGWRTQISFIKNVRTLTHTGSHKNPTNEVGQALFGQTCAMGKPYYCVINRGRSTRRLPTATVAARLGLDCGGVYMGAVDVARPSLNVYRMKLLGAKVVAVESGSRP